MSNRNGYKALVQQRASGEVKRRRLDDYETPTEVTEKLLSECALKGPVLEPACGSGRITRVLKDAGVRVTGADIKQGAQFDFLKRTKPFAGDIVTNPPYRDNLAERFTRHALKLANGRVCMLIQSGFLWGSKRAKGLFSEVQPDLIVIVPERIRFFEGGKPIKSQFFSHAWICFPARKARERGGYETRVVWAN